MQDSEHRCHADLTHADKTLQWRMVGYVSGLAIRDSFGVARSGSQPCAHDSFVCRSFQNSAQLG